MVMASHCHHLRLFHFVNLEATCWESRLNNLRTLFATVHNDQLCYEVDLEKLKNPVILHVQLKLGLVFFMDYNEDKQVRFENSSKGEATLSMGQAIDVSNENENAIIYLNTIGK